MKKFKIQKSKIKIFKLFGVIFGVILFALSLTGSVYAQTASPSPIPTVSFDNYIWQYSSSQNVTGADDLKARLETEVNKVIKAGHLAPFREIYGKDQAHFFWYHPYDTIYTLSLAYPYVNSTTQAAIKSYLQTELQTYPIWYQNPNVWNSPILPVDVGFNREPDDLPAGQKANDFNVLRWGYHSRPSLFGLYALWLYAQNTGDWQYVETNWSNITAFYNAYRSETTQFYSSIAGAIGMARMAKEKPTPDTTIENTAITDVNTGLTNGENFTQFGLNAQNTFVPSITNLAQFVDDYYMGFQFLDITPEIGRYFFDNPTLKDNVLGTTNPSTYSLSRAQYLFNLWYVPQAPYYTTYHGEDSGLPPDTKAMLFPIHAWVLQDSPTQLRKYLDAPDALVGDYYYMQNLTRTIESSGTECWTDIKTGTYSCGATPTSTPIPPIPTATPTPTSAPCSINNLAWSTNNTIQGTPVTLTASASNCDGSNLTFEVRRNGSTFLDDIPAKTQPTLNPVTITNNQASTSWTAEYNPLMVAGVPLGDPQYYFRVSFDGGTTWDSLRPTLLTVTQASVTTNLSISNITDNSSSYPNSQLPKYEKYEITFNVNNSVATNFQMPFDPAPPPGIATGSGITVNAQFSQDNFQTYSIQPAFYYEDFDYQVKSNRDWIYPNGNYSWKVRFAPDKEGTWQYRLTAQDKSGTTTSSTQTFTVVSNPNNHGFIKVSPKDKRYFEYEDGTYFPGLGYNMNFDQISWNNPVLDNQNNFNIMKNNGIQLIRMWLPQWGIFGSQDNPWASIVNGADTALSTGVVAPGSDTSMFVMWSNNPSSWSGDPCMFWGWLKTSPAIKQNISYHISIKYNIPNQLPGPSIAGQPYGLVAKFGNWLSGSQYILSGDTWRSGQECTYPAALANQAYNQANEKVLTPYVSTATSGWSTLEGDFTTDNNTIGGGNFLPYFYIVLENITNSGSTDPYPVAYIDQVEVKENLGNGQYGPNLFSKPLMSHLQYFDQRQSYAFDKVLDLAKQNDIYFKITALEKNEFTQNSFDFNGNPVAYNSGPYQSYYYYGNWGAPTKIYWLQQAYWRYLQARWGYSVNIHSWELNNEGDPFNGPHYTLANNFAKYMHQFGPDAHLVSTSLWHSYPYDELWANSSFQNIDYIDSHLYKQKGASETVRVDYKGQVLNPTVYQPNDFYDTATFNPKYGALIGTNGLYGVGTKPVMRGESGFYTVDANNISIDANLFTADTQAVWLHKWVWSLINSSGLYDASYWYPNIHIYTPQYTGATFDHRNVYKPYYNFIKDIPLNNGNYIDASASATSTNLRAWGQKDPVLGRAHLWIDNKTDTWNNVVNNSGAIATASGTITIPSMPQGTYTASWYDTYAGNVSRTENINVGSDGVVSLTVNNLSTDIAVKLENQSIPSVTPTPIPTTCTITSGTWNPKSTTQGLPVTLSVSASGSCTNQQVSFTIFKNGLCGGQLNTTITPNPVTITNNSASASWNSEFTSDLCGTLGAPNQYYFNATVNGVATSFSNSLLSVSPNVTPTPTPVPGVPRPLPLVSRNLPIFASSGTTTYINDNDYGSLWSGNIPGWLAFDISTLSTTQKSKIVFAWYNDPVGGGGCYNYTLMNCPYTGIPAAYTIEGNTATSGSTVPTSGWVNLATVTGNPYNSRQQVLDLTNYNWVRMNISAVNDSTNRNTASIEADLYDGSQGLDDDWIFYGDSITDYGLGHGRIGSSSTGNFSQLINAANNNFFPLFQDGGVGGSSSSMSQHINEWLALFPGKYVAINFGTNDVLGGITPSNYYNNMVTMVQAVINAGKVPIVPKIPWGSASTLVQVPQFNAQIDQLYSNFPQIIHGPDLYTFFQNNQSLISADGIHPTADGFAALRQQWTNTMLATVYNTSSSSPTPTPASCNFVANTALWNTTSIFGNSTVNLSVTGNNPSCEGQTVNFSIKRNVTLQTDPEVATASATFGTNLTAVTSWTTPAWFNDCSLNPLGPCNPVYHFDAILGTNSQRSNDLTVTQATTIPTSPDDWPQVQNNPQHTGYSPETFTINYSLPAYQRFKVDWTYPFQPDRVHPITQAIVYQGKVFVGTEGANGKQPTMYTLDAVNPDPQNSHLGHVLWKFVADGPILNSAAADNNRVFFATLNGSVYALDMNGNQLWRKQLSDTGFSTAPIIGDNKVLIGGHNGHFYGLNPSDGSVLWDTNIDASIMMTAAYDKGTDNVGRAFFGAMDMYVYAINTADGSISWKSAKIPGIAFKEYWPVITSGKVVISPLIKRMNAGISPGFPFTDLYPSSPDSSWNWMTTYGPTIAAGNLTQVADAISAQDKVMQDYQSNPSKYTDQVMYLLDETTGQETTAAPNWNQQSLSGAQTPSCVDHDGNLVIPIDFTRSGWGRLNLNYPGGPRVVDVLYDGRDYNEQPFTRSSNNTAGFGNNDEDLNPTCAGNVIFSMHLNENNANYTGAFDLNNRRWTQINPGYVNRQMDASILEGRTDPVSISNGKIYHISIHELVVREVSP